MLGAGRAWGTSIKSDRLVYDELFEAIRTKLRLIGFEGNDLDDLVQLTCLTGHQRNVWMPNDIPGTKRRLVAIARRSAANFRRLHRHAREELVDPRILDEMAITGEEGELDAELRVLLAEVMPAADCELIGQYHVHGASLADIAAATGISKSAVQRRLEGARDRVRQRLLEENGCDEDQMGVCQG